MSLKNDLKSKKAQAVLEYSLVFTALIASVFVVFCLTNTEPAFTPLNLKLWSPFSGAIDRAIDYINLPGK